MPSGWDHRVAPLIDYILEQRYFEGSSFRSVLL